MKFTLLVAALGVAASGFAIAGSLTFANAVSYGLSKAGSGTLPSDVATDD